MDLTIDRDSRTPLYLQISRSIRALIVSGKLPAGFRLPPERRLASALRVNRTTVLAAYRELKADSLVDAHVGRGTIVLPRRFDGEPAPSVAEVPWRQLYRQGVARAQDPLVRDLLDITEGSEVISLSAGLPAPELQPVQTLARIMEELVAEVGPACLSHSPTEGLTSLRESIAALMTARGVTCTPAEVLVLSGSQQGLDLMARLFLEPGDLVVVEDPSFFGALQAFRAAQVRLIGVPVDAEGMRTDVLETLLERHRPKLIYTLPSFQNPSGAVLSPSRRDHLLQLAYRFQIPILEDDPYSELTYEGPPPPPLAALDRHHHVVYLSTFSKLLFPGLRLGWVVAPRPVVRQLVLAKQAVDLHSGTLGQWMMNRFLRQANYPRHVRTVRDAYHERRDVMAAALARSAPPSMTWTTPAGGFYFWCRLPEGIDQSRLMARAAAAGVSYLPGSACFVDPPEADMIRLNFSFPSPALISEGVERLCAVIREAATAPRRSEMDAGETRPIV